MPEIAAPAEKLTLRQGRGRRTLLELAFDDWRDIGRPRDHWQNANGSPTHLKITSLQFLRGAAMNGQLLDLSSPVPAPAGLATEGRRESSRYLGVQFACCDVYSRIYANRAGTEYVGHCPRCAKRVRFEIGPGGSDSRFFIAQ